jgi:hypothetical protein
VSFPRELVLLGLAFAAGTAVAGIFGAVNLGTAFAVGQISFSGALVYVLLRY